MASKIPAHAAPVSAAHAAAEAERQRLLPFATRESDSLHEEVRRLGRCPAFAGIAKVVPVRPDFGPALYALLVAHAGDSEWTPIKLATSRRRWPDAPPPEPIPQRELSLEERLARLEALARRRGDLAE